MSETELQRIGRYEVRRELGRGMMGVVYEAVDPLLDRAVALKTVHTLFATTAEERAAYERRFFAEAKAVARLSHPGIVIIHDVGQDGANGPLYIALELLRGRTLADLVDGVPRPWTEALRIVAQIAAALHHAHEAGVIHRDVKPENIMVTETGVAKLMDFGIARIESVNLTAAGQVFGTPRYMSPEQAHGEPVDPRSDLFALGSIAYLLLTGRHAFGAPTVPRVLAQVVGEQPPAPSTVIDGIPPDVDLIVQRALAKTRDARYQSGREMVEDIEDVLAARAPRHASIEKVDHPLQTLLDMPDEVLEEASPDVTPVDPSLTIRPRREMMVAGVLAVAGVLLLVFLTTRARRPSTAPLVPPTTVAAVATPPPSLAPAAVESPSAVAPARVAFDLEHPLKAGRVRVWAAEKLLVDAKLEGETTRKLGLFKSTGGSFERSLEVPSGNVSVRVDVLWESERRSETVAARLKPGATRKLEARLEGRGRKLALEWR